MKIVGAFFLILFLSCQFALAQDTLYVYKSGVVVTKRAVSEIDSITFYKDYNAPVQETLTDIDGNVYHSVKIGTQTWMVENLKVTKYRNGESIPNVTDNDTWLLLGTGACCNYNNDAVNVAKYGKLYNWYALADSRNIAPAGWHVPSDAEWTTLTTFLGGESMSGGKLKETGTTDWASPNANATNRVGFSALPGGYRGNYDGGFYGIGNYGYWWGFSDDGTCNGWNRGMSFNFINVGRNRYNKSAGFSLRCVKDTLALPTLITTAASSLSNRSAISGGNISADGGTTITARGVCWSTSPNPTITDSKTTDGTGIGAYPSLITGLTANTTYYARAYATNSVGTAYGDSVSFTTTQTVIDADGNVYNSVRIGTQTWMVENLKTTKFNDGTGIPLARNQGDWANLSTPGYCWYNNDSISYKNTYGALYNWYAVNTGKLAPAGWHVASDAEWTTLTTFLGADVAGGKLKETGTTHWMSPNIGATNETGFTALPGGNRGNNDGTFDAIGIGVFWWTSTQQDGIYSYFRSVGCNGSGVGRSGSQRLNGLYVRCVKD
ncbi:MAG: fibrobacter succinogenes major paralogous domain-containing protein [Bacteroidota bacterium]|nr:fibrobacter succinogenes major paralogous domain-containing protein [Bacteroidota bacterium]